MNKVYIFFLKEMLINSLCGKIINDAQGLPVGRPAHGAQEPRHILKYVEVMNLDISYPAPRGMSAMAIRPHRELISVSLTII